MEIKGVKNTEIISKNLFEYDGYACFCRKDIENVTPGDPPKATLKLNSDPSRELSFSYSSKTGLNLTGLAGGKIDMNILGKILAIPDNNVDACVDFFESYGFFFPLSAATYTPVDGDSILAIINRIKSTVKLMNAIAEKNYRNVLVNAVYLLYAPCVIVSSSDYIYHTCKHRYTELIETYSLFPDISREQEVFSNGTYSVPDSLLGKMNPIDIDFYNAVRSGAKSNIVGSDSPWFRNLMAAYVGCQNEDSDTRILLEFFYYFQTTYSVFKDVQYRRIVPYGLIDEKSYNELTKKSLLRIARIVAAKEINHNIQGIHPKYDGEKMSVSWQIHNFLQAIYFSIFYMNAGVEIYKECENPNCKRDRFFLVEATRTNKKYCCKQCANAAAAQRHRNRQLAK